MWEVNRIIKCDTWEDLKKTAKRHQEMGFKCEVRGWEDIRDNKLTVLDDWETRENASEYEGTPTPIQAT